MIARLILHEDLLIQFSLSSIQIFAFWQKEFAHAVKIICSCSIVDIRLGSKFVYE